MRYSYASMKMPYACRDWMRGSGSANRVPRNIVMTYDAMLHKIVTTAATRALNWQFHWSWTINGKNSHTTNEIHVEEKRLVTQSTQMYSLDWITYADSYWNVWRIKMGY